MAVDNHIVPSATNSGVGDAVNALHIKNVSALDIPAYSGGSQPGQGDARITLQFIMTNGSVTSPVNEEWTFASTSARDAELILVNTTIGTVVAP